MSEAGTARLPVAVALLRAAHIGPASAVTVAVALLALSAEVPGWRGLALIAAVLAGQLTVGWGNDLLDAGRDRQAGRTDKPLANDELTPALVRRCLLVAAVSTIALSLLAGWRPGLVHLLLGVAAGHLYNLYLKNTPFSWLPYAVAFGNLPVAVALADDPWRWPPLWMSVTAAALGVAAHFLNVLPDLEADEATGIKGLPHRIGPTYSRTLAITLLVVASAAAVLGPADTPPEWSGAVLLTVALLAVVAFLGRGRIPFYAAILIALVDVALLTLTTW